MSKTYRISTIANGAPASAATFNTPINLVLDALNDLSVRIDSLFNKSAVFQYDVTVSSDAQIGDLLYFDSLNGAVFRPAKALLSANPGSGGQSILAPSSRVLGILIDKTLDTSGTLLRCGYYEEASGASIINNTIEDTTKTAGLYYLSPRSAGKATKLPGWNMRQPCISYYGDGKFSMITNYLAHDNHHHAYIELTNPIPASTYTGSDSVLDGSYVYIVDTSVMGLLSPETSVVFYKGRLASKLEFTIGKSTVSYNGVDTPLSSVYLFNVIPFAYGDSVVRSIGTTTLKLSASSGSVNIDMPEYTRQPSVKSARAISNISSNNLLFTPVVSKLSAGAGIYVANVGNGLHIIAASGNIGTPVKALLMYMNGTQRVATSLLTYTVFPRDIQSSAVVSMPVLNSSNLQLDVSVWAQVKADTSCDLDVLLYWVPLKQQIAALIPTSPQATGRFMVPLGAANSLVYQLLKLNYTIALSGTLVAKFISQTPQSDTYLYQIGFKLLAVASGLTTTTQNTDSDLDAAIMLTISRVLTYNANY